MILIQTFVLLIGFSLFPSKSDAVCNTANFTKDITAARLTLADGTVFSNIVVQRGTLQTQPNVSSNNFKDLNLLFIIKADDDATLNYIKTGLNTFIEQLYAFYGNPATGSELSNKIRVGMIPFKDIPSTGSVSSNVLKTGKEQIRNQIASLDTSNERSLKDAMDIALTTMTENSAGGRNGDLAQQIVLITDGLQEEQECRDANVALRDLSDNMIAMYGILFNVSPSSNENIRNLINEVYEMNTTTIGSWTQVEAQLLGYVLDYIKQFGIKTDTINPVGSGTNTIFSSEGIVITVDEEYIHGATLEIEYEMAGARYAYYGSGDIISCIIKDHKDIKMGFSQDQKLLTEPNKTNAHYGWHQEGTDIVTDSGSGTAKLVLSTTITPEQIEDELTYENSATCDLIFDVGDSTQASYQLTATALPVSLLPPFGTEDIRKETEPWIPYLWIATISVTSLGIGWILIHFAKKIKK